MQAREGVQQHYADEHSAAALAYVPIDGVVRLQEPAKRRHWCSAYRQQPLVAAINIKLEPHLIPLRITAILAARLKYLATDHLPCFQG
jgi:hypothetical protein